MTAKMITAVRLTPSPEENANARKTGISASRTKPIAFGIVHGFSGWPESVCGGGGPGAVQAGQPPERQPRPLRGLLRAGDRVLPGLARRAAAAGVVAYGRLRHSSTAASAAPSSGMERVSRPRRTCASTSPEASVRRPTVSRSGTPSSSASANFSPGPASRSS